MKRVLFDYPHTCPKIDKEIGYVKDEFHSHITELIRDICPYIPTKTIDQMVEGFATTLYDSIEGVFEEVRRTNSDMRNSAETQIESLVDTISNLENEIDSLKDRISDLETECNNYECNNYEFQK